MLAELPVEFRAACHWALFAAAICGQDGLTPPAIPHGAPPAAKLAAQREAAHVIRLHRVLFPEDE